MSTHIAIITRDVESAKRLYAPDSSWSAESVGYFIQSGLQGAFIFAKAKQGPEVVRESLAHLRRYLGLSSTSRAQPNERKSRDFKHEEVRRSLPGSGFCDGGLGQDRPGN
jgi:TetR/AcrR family transcriptional repressor of nem operon